MENVDKRVPEDRVVSFAPDADGHLHQMCSRRWWLGPMFRMEFCCGLRGAGRSEDLPVPDIGESVGQDRT